MNQGDSETQRNPSTRFTHLTQSVLGFTMFLGIYSGLLGVVYFGISMFDCQARSTQPTEPIHSIDTYGVARDWTSGFVINSVAALFIMAAF